MTRITANELRAKWRGKDQWLSDGGPRGAGRLVARIGRESVSFLYQYFSADGRKRFLPMGPFDVGGVRGLSLAQARDRSASLSNLYRTGIKDLHAHFEREHAEKERARAAEEAAAQQTHEKAQRYTLQELMNAYAGHLQSTGRESAGQVRNIFRKHVSESEPALASRWAREVGVQDFVRLIGKVVSAGKGRTAGKLRSYLHAMYGLAISSKTDPSVPAALRDFDIEVNPISGIAALSQFNRVLNRHLNALELHAFLKRLRSSTADSAKKDAVHLCIFLGGQRPTQLLRLRPRDVNLPARTITLLDKKGRRKQPREHVIPLTTQATTIIKRRMEGIQPGEDRPLFSTDNDTQICLETVSKFVSEIADAMVKAGEAEPFDLGDLRRTAETMLAGLGISSDTRKQIQSHGLGGVQQRHYDRHDYMREKRRALEQWRKRLEKLTKRKSSSHSSRNKRAGLQ